MMKIIKSIHFLIICASFAYSFDCETLDQRKNLKLLIVDSISEWNGIDSKIDTLTKEGFFCLNSKSVIDSLCSVKKELLSDDYQFALNNTIEKRKSNCDQVQYKVFMPNNQETTRMKYLIPQLERGSYIALGGLMQIEMYELNVKDTIFDYKAGIIFSYERDRYNYEFESLIEAGSLHDTIDSGSDYVSINVRTGYFIKSSGTYVSPANREYMSVGAGLGAQYLNYSRRFINSDNSKFVPSMFLRVEGASEVPLLLSKMYVEIGRRYEVFQGQYNAPLYVSLGLIILKRIGS